MTLLNLAWVTVMLIIVHWNPCTLVAEERLTETSRVFANTDLLILTGAGAKATDSPIWRQTLPHHLAFHTVWNKSTASNKSAGIAILCRRRSFAGNTS